MLRYDREAQRQTGHRPIEEAVESSSKWMHVVAGAAGAVAVVWALVRSR